MNSLPLPARTRRALLVAAAALLSACASPPPLAPSTDATPSWSGRLGLQIHDPQAQAQSFSASFHLQGAIERGQLDIFNPLGSQVAELRWQPGHAQLRQGDQLRTSASLDELLHASVGTPLPVEALLQWLQGQPANADGWSADLSRYAQGRITAQRLSPAPQATLRLVLQQPD